MKWYLLALLPLLLPLAHTELLLKEISNTRTSFLEKYEGYVNVVLAHFLIPRDTLFASFQFRADEMKMSIFSCSARRVSLYVKHKSAPVVNPDGSKFPREFKEITRTTLHNIEFLSDKKMQYWNLTGPEPGSYFVAVFLSYTDPKHAAITQQGLGAQCFAYMDASVYITKPLVEQVVDNTENTAYLTEQLSSYYKFFVPNKVDHVVMAVDDISGAANLTIRIDMNKIPSNNDYNNTVFSASTIVSYSTPESTWYYIEFKSDNNASLTFSLKYFTDEQPNSESDYYVNYANSTPKVYYSTELENVVPYKEYELVRQARTESFIFTYALEKELALSEPLAVNISSDEFALLKFTMRENTDLGGTLHYILAFKPRLNKAKKMFDEEPEEHTVVGCIRSGSFGLPRWPNVCEEDGVDKPAPIVLNKTVDNSTIEIPFPESGTWFATFKLFCGKCEPCKCPNKCQEEFAACTSSCEASCEVDEACAKCAVDCKDSVVTKKECKGCDCDGPCLKTDSAVCNTSIVFDISSMSCVEGGCGKNGKCMIMVSEGIVYSTCVCMNNYRGWDCSDDSQANPYWMIVLELLLLVLSNLMFLPAAYFACKHKYYVESLVYLSICFFSTFYHACDAGEKIISFCITRLGALQFADFFCAVLALWMTLIAMADLPSYWTSVCQMMGAIILAFVVTINKTSMWVFLVPTVAGLVILAVSWYFKWRKVRRLFLNKRYVYIQLPLGIVFVTTGLVIFAALETTDNYKYLHSLWHMMMATSIIIALPRENTFQPETML